jgi:hypothetical protein
MSERRALVLIGSPRGSRSTSRSLGTYLLRRLETHGIGGSELTLAGLRRAESPAELVTAVGAASVVVLATPLYWDSLPAVATAALEELAATPEVRGGGKQFALIVNSGFPEAHQSAVSVDIAAAFAREVGYAWAGGLVVPCGGAIDGKPLEALGGMARRLRDALDRSAAALAAEEPIPEEALRLAGRGFMPAWAYPLIGEMMWRLQAWKHGTLFRLRDRPYAENDPR